MRLAASLLAGALALSLWACNAEDLVASSSPPPTTAAISPSPTPRPTLTPGACDFPTPEPTPDVVWGTVQGSENDDFAVGPLQDSDDTATAGDGYQLYWLCTYAPQIPGVTWQPGLWEVMQFWDYDPGNDGILRADFLYSQTLLPCCSFDPVGRKRP